MNVYVCTKSKSVLKHFEKGLASHSFTFENLTDIIQMDLNFFSISIMFVYIRFPILCGFVGCCHVDYQKSLSFERVICLLQQQM